MIKVILESAAGREADLFPECFRIREVLERLHVDPSETVNTVNGVLLGEEDLDRNLVKFSLDDEVQISSGSHPAGGSGTPETMTVVLNDSQMQLLQALQNIQAALNEAFKILAGPQSEELPF